MDGDEELEGMTIDQLKSDLGQWPGGDSRVIVKLPAGDGSSYRYQPVAVAWDSASDSLAIVVDSTDELDALGSIRE